MGLKFFLIYLCLLVIFQLMNIVLSRECGPISVTEYNVSYKYFSIVYMGFVIIVSPMWAAFTDAYSRNDKSWMKSTLNKLEKVVFVSFFLCVLMLVVSQIAYSIWLGDKLSISWLLSSGVAIYVMSQIFGALYMYLINGLGVLRIQLMIYLSFALVSFPLMTLLCRLCGAIGIIVIPSLVYLTQGIILRKQLNLIINERASGIWIK